MSEMEKIVLEGDEPKAEEKTIDMGAALGEEIREQLEAKIREAEAAGAAAEPEKKQKKESGFEKQQGEPVTESPYLRYLADMRKADSELALAKAQSAELVMQMDQFKKHYVEYEKYMIKLLRKIDSNYSEQMDELIELADEIEKNSASLESRIHGEIRRLTEALAKKLDEDVKASCEQELARIGEATQILAEYRDKIIEENEKFEKQQRMKFVLLLVSSICSPLVLLLMILSMCNLI